MRTEFGKYLKKLRVDNNGERLIDMSNRLGISMEFLSSVECGKKHIPQGWRNIIIKEYKLGKEQQEELEEAIDCSQMYYTIYTKGASDIKRKALRKFVYNFDNLDDDTAQQIIDLLVKE